MNKEEARVEGLLEALKEAREMVATWGPYAGDYFVEKHGLSDDLALIDAAIARATYQAEKGGVMTPEQAAYGALWRMMTANPFLKNARACLLTAIGGKHSEGHREAIAWAVATFDPVSDAEISRLEL